MGPLQKSLMLLLLTYGNKENMYLVIQATEKVRRNGERVKQASNKRKKHGKMDKQYVTLQKERFEQENQVTAGQFECIRAVTDGFMDILQKIYRSATKYVKYQGGGMTQLKLLLDEFFSWARYTSSEYAEGKGPFQNRDGYDESDFPKLNELISSALDLLNCDKIDQDDMNDFLTALAIDNESKWILDCCSKASDQFVMQLVKHGFNHEQLEARWQIAELLRRRSIPERMYYLKQLLQDPQEYVRRRAKMAIKFLDVQMQIQFIYTRVISSLIEKVPVVYAAGTFIKCLIVVVDRS